MVLKGTSGISLTYLLEKTTEVHTRGEVSLDSSLTGTGLWECNRRDLSTWALLTFGAKYILVWQGGRFFLYFMGYLTVSLSSILWMPGVYAHVRTHTHPPICDNPKCLQILPNIPWSQNHTQFKTSALEVLSLKISSPHLPVLISMVSLRGK